MSGGSGSARSDEDESVPTASTNVAERPSKRAASVPDPFAETRLADSGGGDAFDTDRIAPSLPTALFERYKIKRKLGAGGMGVVYEALDQNLHRVVALKVLKLDEDPTQLAEAANRLVREARAMAVLSHKNVVTVYDVGIHGLQVYVAMQLVDGTTLRKWLEAAPRTSSQVLRVLCDAGAGLAAAHGARLIHRDFKPDNVLVSRRNNVRVTDFGLARRANFEAEANTSERTSRPKVLDPSHSVDNVTRSGAILGTPAYMPPEQSEGRPCDARADQFSFCVTAWEALYGVRPFAGKTWSELYSNVIAGNVVDPDSKSRVPRAIQKALRRGMSVEPADRFATMGELLEVLETGIEREKSWLRYIAIPLVSAGVAAGIAFFVTRESASPATRAAVTPPAGSAQAAPAGGAVPPTPPVTVEPIPAEAPHIQQPPTVPDAVVAAEDTTKKKRRSDRHKKQDAASHVETTGDATENPVVDEVPAPKAPDPAEGVRARRKAIDATMHERGLRSGDTPAASAALADAEAALNANDLPAAQKALGDAERAIAAIVIDYEFINAKLSRINKRLQQSAGREEEFRALLKELMELMRNKQFAAANKLLNDISDRLARK